jgi:RNA-directed DNA polymerase
MSLTTPPNVRELQIALYVKAKANPTYRFYALYDKIYRKDVLLWAWGCCRANGRAPASTAKVLRRLKPEE